MYFCQCVIAYYLRNYEVSGLKFGMKLGNVRSHIMYICILIAIVVIVSKLKCNESDMLNKLFCNLIFDTDTEYQILLINFPELSVNFVFKIQNHVTSFLWQKIGFICDIENLEQLVFLTLLVNSNFT